MKKLISLIVILIACPTFATCPIDSDACVAEFQQTSLPDIILPASKPFSSQNTGNFLETPATVQASREYEPKNNLRNFRSTEQDYGYNSSCQFGVCMDTGTPKVFPQE